MDRYTCEFSNELDNRITITTTVINNGSSVRVTSSGPTSEVDHEWTLAEANVLYSLLGQSLGKNESMFPDSKK